MDNNYQLDKKADVECDAIILTISKELKKRDNATRTMEFYQCTVQIISGPAKGKVVFARRTMTADATGREKSEVKVGQEVHLYGNLVQGTIVNGKAVPPALFFEISTTNSVDANDDVLKAFGFTSLAVVPSTPDVVMEEEVL